MFDGDEVFGTARGPLHPDEVFDIGDRNFEVAHVEGGGGGAKICIAGSARGHAQDVEWAKECGERERVNGRKRSRLESEWDTFFDAAKLGVQIGERIRKPLEVVRRAVVADIEVTGDEFRPEEGSGESPDQDELDTVGVQRAKTAERIEAAAQGATPAASRSSSTASAARTASCPRSRGDALSNGPITVRSTPRPIRGVNSSAYPPALSNRSSVSTRGVEAPD